MKVLLSFLCVALLPSTADACLFQRVAVYRVGISYNGVNYPLYKTNYKNSALAIVQYLNTKQAQSVKNNQPDVILKTDRRDIRVPRNYRVYTTVNYYWRLGRLGFN